MWWTGNSSLDSLTSSLWTQYVWCCIKEGFFAYMNVTALYAYKCSLTHTPAKRQESLPKQIKCQWGPSMLKNKSVVAQITKGSVNNSEIRALDQGWESTVLYDWTFMHLHPLLSSSALLTLPLTKQMTSLLLSLFSFRSHTFHPFTQMRSLHWFRSSCYGLGASGRHSSTEPQITSLHRASCPAVKFSTAADPGVDTCASTPAQLNSI